MRRKHRRWLIALVPAVLISTALALPVRPVAAEVPAAATTSLCPICGGGWDDYWDLVRNLVDIEVSIARRIVGV